MKIITYNCFGIPYLTPHLQARLKNLVGEVAKLNVDIAFFQEIFFSAHKRLLAKSLKELPYHYTPKDGILKLGGGLCCFSKFKLDNCYFQPFSLNGHLSNQSFIDKLVQKGFMRVQVRGTNYYNVHLTCNYKNDFTPGNKYYDVQKLQLKELAEDINKLSIKSDSFVVGDFNIPPTAEMFIDFLKSIKGIDLTPSFEPSLVGMPNSLIGQSSEKQKLDYIIYRGPNQLKATWKYIFKEPQLSDHLGIELQTAPEL